jgi:sugar diacid utilization regulator
LSTTLERELETPEESTTAGLRRAFAAFRRLAAAVDTAATLEDLLHVVATEASQLVGVERCSIHLRDRSAGLFHGCVGHAGDFILDADIKKARSGLAADGVTRELLETRRPVIVDNAQTDPRTVKSAVRLWRIRSIMAVPMLRDDEVVGIICLDDVDRSHTFTLQDADAALTFAGLASAAVVNTRSRVELRGQLEASERQVRTLRRAMVVEQRLSDLVLQGRSVQVLLEALAEALGKPVAMFDADGRRVGTASPEGTADAVAPRLLEPPYVDHPEVRDALAAHAEDRAFVVGPLPAAGVLHRHVVAPVGGNGETWGRLVVMEHKRRFTGGDIVTVRRAACLVALQIATDRKAAEADWDAGASLVAELLGGSDTTFLRRRADRLGVRLDAPRLVALVGTRQGGEAGLPDFRSVSAAFRRLAPALSVQATALHGAVAALIEVPACDEEAVALEAVTRVVTGVCQSVRGGAEPLVAGVSAVHSDPCGYRAAYAEADQVLDCIRRFSPASGPAVFAADELGAGRLFLATSDPALVQRFAEDTFGALVADASKADLLTTLCSFFDNMASIRRSALSLGLHENTIRYRLSRIEELTGLAVTHDPDAQLQARLSLLVLLLQGRLPAHPKGRASRRELVEVSAVSG